MTIHHIINDYNLALGGAQHLVQKIHLACLHHGLSSKLLGLSKDPGSDIHEALSIKSESPYSINSFFGLWKYLKKEVNEGDLLHIHLFPAIFYVSVLKTLGHIRNCRLILTDHSTLNNRREVWWGKLIDNFTYNSYDTIVAISDGVAASLSNWITKSKNKIIVINNGAEMRYKNFYERPTQKSSVIIVSIGRINGVKNYENALNALTKIKHLNFEYWIAGKGPLREALISQATRLKIKHKVKFLGFVNDIPELLKKADIFLMPSLWEGFGLAAIEAMNAGLPCIISNVPGLGDLIERDGYDGILVDPMDKNKIVEKLEMLMKSPELRLEMGQAAHERAKRFDLNIMINSYIAIYNKYNA